MTILGISGSASPNSSNFYLLKAIQQLLAKNHQMEVYDDIHLFDLFTPQKLEKGIPDKIQLFKEKLVKADAVIISTPEYTHNIPAVLKNMIEWCTHSGEFSETRILPITFTPNEPRGEYAMQSLLGSLQTMKAKVVTQLPLYKTDVKIEDQQISFKQETREILEEAFKILLT
ncbi:MAG: NADPH-dependent FMN reductase [Flavobacteriaceae bacterium]